MSATDDISNKGIISGATLVNNENGSGSYKNGKYYCNTLDNGSWVSSL